jgi:GNAT superfamily N-acetyltransferase
VSSTRSRIEQLEAIAYDVWVAPEVADLDGWRLRFAHGLTGRANSVWPNGEGSLPLDEKLRRAEGWYRTRGVPVLFQLTDAARPRGLEAALAERGYRRNGVSVSVQLANLDDVVARSAGEAAVATTLDEAWLELWAGSRGFEKLDVGRALLEHGDVAFASIDGVAAGRGVAVGEWLGITSMITAPSERRRGHARSILHALARWGAARGCRQAILQVDSSNKPALALYGAAGFAEHHEYRYWILR